MYITIIIYRLHWNNIYKQAKLIPYQKTRKKFSSFDFREIKIH